MSKLFELYVLGLLKERFKVPGEVKYHFTKQRNELDYLIHAGNIRVVGDAKYKKGVYDKNDIRQLSGYARITAVAEELNIPPDQTIDCLIFYPDQSNGVDDLLNAELLHERNAIRKFTKFYKVGVRLPIIK
jgi:5-methylcytosine-specific restriction enzyme subunit McrC